jgi:FMN phosphatase YigB (HAD superfamily)
MMKILLLDLDGTLLKNDIDAFIPVYLQILARNMASYVNPDRMIAQILKGTDAMLNNTDAEKTLEQVFDENFYGPLGFEKSELRPRFDTFYQQEFPKLKTLTEPVPDAKRLISYALSHPLEIVIATNPLFPLMAIEERLKWAAIPSNEYPYDLITSYESFHFAKPHLEYFAEVLGKLGRNPHEAAMIGNALRDDLRPAQELGMAVFHVADQPQEGLPGGNLSDAIEWLKCDPHAPEPSEETLPNALLARLRGNLSTFLSMQAEIEDCWKSRPAATSWAPVEVVCHLRDVEEEVNFPRLEKIIFAEQPFLPAPDSDQWAEQRHYLEQNPYDAMQELIRARKRTIDLLSSRPSHDWKRQARHAIFGPTQLGEIVRIFLEHDLVHIRQIRDALTTVKSH